jgi:alkane 1-monooxygenase
MLLASVCYMHFTIEHVHGHHRHVGTPRDPATARLGEPSYAFIVRSVLGGARSAWQIEMRQLAKQNRPTWNVRNRMVRYACVQLGVIAGVAWMFGWLGLAVFLAQSIVAFSLLEIINYIEHYGLFRREIAPGRYERVEPWHSWNSSHRVSNWILINLARHADHHLTASKRYQVLHTLDAAPQLPAGYSAMVLLALTPPLWRRVMDPRVQKWRNVHGVEVCERFSARSANL